MSKVLERKASASLFKETATERFRRESLEIWENLRTEEKLVEGEEGVSRLIISEDATVDSSSGRLASDKPLQRRRSTAGILKPTEKTDRPDPTKKEEMFPKKLKSRLVKTQPASWEIKEKNEDDMKEEKKENIKERKSRSKEVKPVRRIGDKIVPGPNIRKI